MLLAQVCEPPGHFTRSATSQFSNEPRYAAYQADQPDDDGDAAQDISGIVKTANRIGQYRTDGYGENFVDKKLEVEGKTKEDQTQVDHQVKQQTQD
jgi:hypothetical protein